MRKQTQDEKYAINKTLHRNLVYLYPYSNITCIATPRFRTTNHAQHQQSKLRIINVCDLLLISQLFVTPYYASGKSSSVWLRDISEYKTKGIRRPISNVNFSRLSVFLWSSYMEGSCCPSLRRRQSRMCLWTSLGYYSNPFN